MRRILTALVLTCLSACAPNRAAYDAALERPIPPQDFWLAVTVLGPARSTGYGHLPRAERPARYVLESDRVLRAGLGPGAAEFSFPPQLRPLSDEQWQRVWDVLRETSLARSETDSDVSRAPMIEDSPDRTVIVLSYVASGVRRFIAVDAHDEDAQRAADAVRVADTLAELAWIPERAAQDQ